MKSSNKTKVFLNRLWKSLLLPMLVFVIAAVVLKDRFVNARVLLTIARQVCMPSLMAYSMAMMMQMGMMNFAVGAVIFTSPILAIPIAAAFGGATIPNIFVWVMILSILFMTINGILYNLLKVPCLVTSLGYALIVEALGRMLSKEGTAEIGGREGYLSQSPWCFVILGIGFLIFFVIYNYTVFGHNVRTIGESQAVAAQSGINIDRTKLGVFVMSGFFVGLAAMLYLSTSVKYYAASNLSSMTMIFDALMGVFIALFLAKFSGFPCAILIGVFTMRMLSTALVTFGMKNTLKSISTGMFLLAVLIFSANAMRPAAARLFKESGRKADEEYKLMQAKK